MLVSVIQWLYKNRVFSAGVVSSGGRGGRRRRPGRSWRSRRCRSRRSRGLCTPNLQRRDEDHLNNKSTAISLMKTFKVGFAESGGMWDSDDGFWGKYGKYFKCHCRGVHVFLIRVTHRFRKKLCGFRNDLRRDGRMQ